MPGSSTEPGPYCELHAHTCFSLLDAVPFPEQLVERAAELRLAAIAVVDHDGLYSAVPFFAQAKARGIQPIAGAELTLEDGSHLTLLAADQTGYRNLSQLITLGRANAEKGRAALPWPALPDHAPGLICLTGCASHGPVARAMASRNTAHARQVLGYLVDVFGRSHVYVELQRNSARDEDKLSRQLAALAASCELPCVATGNVHYLTYEDADLQSVLVSVRERKPLHKAKNRLRPNREYLLRSPGQMYALYPDLPQAVANTWEVAQRCQAEPPSGLQVLPTFPTPRGLSASAYLRGLCFAQLNKAYSGNLTRATRWLERELEIIDGRGLANYFLVVWDIVEFCKRRGILCHGRGAAANSLIAYLLGISAVDPIRYDLVTERFVSSDTSRMPDIDLDIDTRRRPIVLQYVYDRWGHDCVSMACTYVTYRSASALRDAGYALGFPTDVIEEIAAGLEEQYYAENDDGRAAAPDVPIPATPGTARLSTAEWQRLVSLASRLKRLPRHLGLHNGGVVVAGEPLGGLIPIEPAAMEGRTVVQWDKDHLERAGIVKIDLLGLRRLTAIADTLRLIEEATGRRIELQQLGDFGDKRIYDLICSGRTLGIFQLESGAQISVLPDMLPRCFWDLAVQISLIRPGPILGNMVKPFLRRRKGLENVTYLHPSLRGPLEKTLGVVIFQEQVIQVCVAFAGFTPSRGEQLRRALGHKHAEEELQRFRDEFIAGALARGVDQPTAESVWKMIEGFGAYSFSEAHALSFAVLAYCSAWLRAYYPVHFFCGLLRASPLGTYPPNVLESEARRAGVEFLPFDVNRSMTLATVEEGRIRFGLNFVKHIGDERAEEIVQLRGNLPFGSLADFLKRVRLPRRAVESLILAGAFDEFGERKAQLWQLVGGLETGQWSQEPQLPLDHPGEQAYLPAMLPERKLTWTFLQTGVTAGLHLTAVRKDAFAKAGCRPYGTLLRMRVGARVKVGGLVADGINRPKEAKGTAFVRLEEPDGIVDVIIPKKLYAACRKTLVSSMFLVVEGEIQRTVPNISLLARRVSTLPE